MLKNEVLEQPNPNGLYYTGKRLSVERKLFSAPPLHCLYYLLYTTLCVTQVTYIHRL